MPNWARWAELDRLGIVSKRREGAGGRLAGGQHFSRGALYLMLQNRIYRGEILHQGEAYPGQHEAIIDPELWQIVQDKLAANRRERSLAVGAEAPSLLAAARDAVLSPDSRVAPGTPISAAVRTYLRENRTGQRVGPVNLTRANSVNSPPRNTARETGLRGWGTWIRTMIKRSQMGYSAGRLALRGGEGCCASG
jgi:hypothetical protein